MEEMGDCWDYLVWVSLRVSGLFRIDNIFYAFMKILSKASIVRSEKHAHERNRTNASASYTATYEQMNREFNTTRLIATIGLSTFVFGIAMGPFWSPLAEFYGRRPIYICSFLAFVIFLVPSAVAKNIETMIVVRFFQGLAGSAFLSVSGGTVGDLFERDKMQAPMAVFAVAPFVGPATGPLLGGVICSFVNWRWLHYVLLMWSFGLLVSIALFVPETYRECPFYSLPLHIQRG